MNFNYSDEIQLTSHFNSKEFKCKCGKSHKFELSPHLITKLEILFYKLNCSKIIVNSGYRCTTHDKNVGGNGSGQHTKGNAADVVCYDKNGKIIDSRKICCTAQDIGFGGIARINTNNTATHLDVRTGSKYYGDETKGNNSVTNDFHKYYNM